MKCVWLILVLITMTDAMEPNLTPFQKKILEEVSWNIKLLLLKEFQNKLRRGGVMIPGRRVIRSLTDEPERKVGIQLLNMPVRRQEEGPLDNTNEDSDMKMKLFRLMYETVRDSDLKVKRAELINSYYINSTAFEIGYLMGDVTDKFNVMSDIAATLKRLYDSWKPIEHINAYEQIANQAIETSHLIELARAVSKRSQEQEGPSQLKDENEKPGPASARYF